MNSKARNSQKKIFARACYGTKLDEEIKETRMTISMHRDASGVGSGLAPSNADTKMAVLPTNLKATTTRHSNEAQSLGRINAMCTEVNLITLQSIIAAKEGL